MPPAEVHPDCQQHANDVTKYKAEVERLRNELQSLTGAAAWQTRAKLGRASQNLAAADAELTACNASHAAALQATLVVMDVDPAAQPDTQERAAQLWQLGTAPGFLEETPVQKSLIGFQTTPPDLFGINVTTTGAGEVSGPDFRGGPISVQQLADANRRIEVVLGPEIRIDAAAIAAQLQKPPDWTGKVDLGAVKAALTLTAAKAALDANAIGGELSGIVTLTSFGGISTTNGFTAGATVRLMPSTKPGLADICDLVNVSDLSVTIPGMAGQYLDALLPLVRPLLNEQLAEHVRTTAMRELHRLVKLELALPDPLPDGVTVSIRRLTINASGITFQPALGALGTTLSQLPPS